jgi:hypothetical protein
MLYTSSSGGTTNQTTGQWYPLVLVYTNTEIYRGRMKDLFEFVLNYINHSDVII